MDRRDLAASAAEVLRSANVRKNINVPSEVFTISNENGVSHNYKADRIEKDVIYTRKDVEVVLDALLIAAEKALRKGEKVSFGGFGTIGHMVYKKRWAKLPETGDVVDINERLIPKFWFGSRIKRAVKFYEQSLSEYKIRPPEPRYDMEVDEEADEE